MSQAHTVEPWGTADPVHDYHQGNTWLVPVFANIAASGDKIAAQAEASNRSRAQANAARIVACVNGCAGLNPAAYRQVVEALRVLQEEAMNVHAAREHPKGALEDAIGEAGEALTAAQEAA